MSRRAERTSTSETGLDDDPRRAVDLAIRLQPRWRLECGEPKDALDHLAHCGEACSTTRDAHDELGIRSTRSRRSGELALDGLMGALDCEVSREPLTPLRPCTPALASLQPY